MDIRAERVYLRSWRQVAIGELDLPTIVLKERLDPQVNDITYENKTAPYDCGPRVALWGAGEAD
jgi:hypothetical protein